MHCENQLIYGVTNTKDVQRLKRKYERLNQSFLPKAAVQQILAGTCNYMHVVEWDSYNTVN